MAKPRKLPSGSWNIQLYAGKDEDGKPLRMSFTAPTKAEVEYKAAQFKKDKRTRSKDHDRTVRQAVEKYIQLSQVLSPSTLAGYDKMLRTGFQDLMPVKVKELNDTLMQQAINAEARKISERTGKPLSPKTVINEWGLLSSALRAVCGLTFNVKLPKKQQHIKELPEPQVVMDAVRGSSIELPCLLAMWLSFSMSEIRGLMCSSVQDGYITISQTMIDVDGAGLIKPNAKTDTRLRRHKLPQYIEALIKDTTEYKSYCETGADGLLVPLSHNQIYGRWQTICEKHGFKMTFHDLRHMNASIMLMLGIPEKYAMERGGWKTPNVMKSVYQHTFSKEREHVDEKIDNYFNNLL